MKQAVSNLRLAKSRPEDWTKAGVLAAFMIQQRGRLTLTQIVAALRDELNVTVTAPLMSPVLKALQKKDFIATDYRGREIFYSVKRLKFNCSVENMHVDRMLLTLYDDPQGMAIKASIEGDIAASKGGKGTKSRGEYPSAWGTFTLRVRVVTPLLGGQPIDGSPYNREAYAKGPFALVDISKADEKQWPLIFDRTPDGLGLMIHRHCLYNFFMDNLPSLGLAPTAISRFGFKNVRIYPKPNEVFIWTKPIQRASAKGQPAELTGAGMGNYEAIIPGVEFDINFDAPTKNFPGIEKLTAWLSRVLASPNRSISPARGKEQGELELVSLTCEVWNAEASPEEDEGAPASEKGCACPE